MLKRRRCWFTRLVAAVVSLRGILLFPMAYGGPKPGAQTGSGKSDAKGWLRSGSAGQGDRSAGWTSPSPAADPRRHRRQSCFMRSRCEPPNRQAMADDQARAGGASHTRPTGLQGKFPRGKRADGLALLTCGNVRPCHPQKSIAGKVSRYTLENYKRGELQEGCVHLLTFPAMGSPPADWRQTGQGA